MSRRLLIVTAFLVFFVCAGSLPLLAQATSEKSAHPAPADWSKALVDSTLTRYPDATKFGGWGYARSLHLFGQYLVYQRTHDPRYLSYIKRWIDSHIDENGKLDREINALDYVLPANLLIILYDETGEERYTKALEIFRHRFDDYLRTTDGGIWHATVPSRQWQLWADGIFMGMLFLGRYGQALNDVKYADDGATKQILVYHNHLKDAKGGLLYHAYDESGKQRWALPHSHHSAYFWCRAIGWFGMATVDILEVLPKNHPRRKELIVIVQRMVKDLAKYQDAKAGLWYQIVDKTHDPNNWQETSSSSMYTYIIDIAVKRGYVSKKYKAVAERGYRGVMSKVSVGKIDL